MNASFPVLSLDLPLGELHGVGPERTAQLRRLNCGTVGDLLHLQPRRHEDRRQFLAVANLEEGMLATVRGRVVDLGVKWFQQRRRSVFELTIDDGAGRLCCRWWNQPYLERQFQVGEELLAFGKVACLRPPRIDQPEIERVDDPAEESIHLNRIVPVYPLTDGLSQRWVRALTHRLLTQYRLEIRERWPLVNWGPWPDSETALRWLHFPDVPDQPERARQRLAREEFLAFQLELRARRDRLHRQTSTPPCPGDNRWIKPWLEGLGFSLTAAQTQVLREIRRDVARRVPMRRLLQGDVGSGKTVVAAATALMALESGWSVVLMAPTEILAEQHHRTFSRWFTPFGIPVHLHTGNHKEAAPPEARSAGQPDSPAGSALTAPLPRMAIGTHALIEKGFELDGIGLAIIDEQHKFGVAQREALLRKGRYPHLLVMTATPIPRTLGLTCYGDLDSSILAEKPPGRGRVRTFVRGTDRLPKVWDFVRAKLAEGRQAYVVYPSIDDADSGGLKAVKREHARLVAEMAPHAVGLMHGRLSAEEKQTAMTAFALGQCRLLVATTAIEVGLDVANASVMIVENADRYGLAQLHQLRGRVGRGREHSYCILVSQAKSAAAQERLRLLEGTENGFEIAEADLRLRGPGEFLGKNQSGRPRFRFGDLTRDLALLEWARQQAALIAPGADEPRG